ncbi:MAG: class I SAM-dependent methyltransferase [Candidatus Thiodiazotropha sp. 6PLUC2]
MTAAVRAFYEAHPYPSGNKPFCDGYHGRLLLSYIERPQGIPQYLHILEAGCGRGVNLTAVAAKESRDQFIGIDINRVAIEEASARAKAHRLSNLNFQVADLLDSTTLPEKGRGFDVILSYGVLHHLNDPLKGLQRLTEYLAPHGVIGFMVDGSYGRQPLDRYLQALDIISPDAERDRDRHANAKALAQVAEEGVFKGNCWQGTAFVDEVEFADRCLHVHEQSYDINGLWDLLEAAGLRFIRWHETLDWSVAAMTDDADLSTQLRALGPRERYQVVERLAYRPKLTLVASRIGDEPRKPLKRAELMATKFALNPQLQPTEDESGKVNWSLRGRPLPINNDRLTDRLISLASESGATFTYQEILQRLGDQQVTEAQALELLTQMLACECFYAPHGIDPGLA